MLGLGLLLLTVLLVTIFTVLLAVTVQAAPAVPGPAPAGGGPAQARSPQARAGGQAPEVRRSPVVEGFVDGDPIVKLLPKDAIEPIDEPNMVPAAAAVEFMRDDELVLGVFDGRQARAYSTWHLDRHEVVNDRLSGAPIAATW